MTWGALEAAGAATTPDLTAAWLGRWVEVYRPARLLAVRVEDPGGAPLGAGLLEALPGGRWRFAGAGASVHRRLIAAPGREREAWGALRGWLRGHAGRFAELELTGAAAQLAGAPGGRADAQPTYALELAADLDALLAQRSRNTRQQLRKKLRRFAEAGGELRTAPAAGRRAALGRMVELHTRRAETQGEHHGTVDGRLVALLDGVAADGRVGVEVFEAVLGGEVVASLVRLDHAGTGTFLQIGLSPEHADLAPGVCVTLEAMRDAMERGLRRFDLGPGEFRYKQDVGGVRADHWRVVVPSRSLRGLAVRGARELRARAGAR